MLRRPDANLAHTVALVLAVSLAACTAADPTPGAPTLEPAPPRVLTAVPAPTEAPPVSETEFRRSMARLWEDHVLWTRMYIVSVAADSPDTDAIAARLMRNQTDIGQAIVLSTASNSVTS